MITCSEVEAAASVSEGAILDNTAGEKEMILKVWREVDGTLRPLCGSVTRALSGGVSLIGGDTLCAPAVTCTSNKLYEAESDSVIVLGDGVHATTQDGVTVGLRKGDVFARCGGGSEFQSTPPEELCVEVGGERMRVEASLVYTRDEPQVTLRVEGRHLRILNVATPD